MFALRCLVMAIAFSSCSLAGASNEQAPLQPIMPTYEKLADGSTTLKGWRSAPAPHSSNRIIIDTPGYNSAMVLTISEMPVDFDAGLLAALAKEGLTDVRLTAKRNLSGTLTDAFSEAIKNPDGRYATFIATAKGRWGPVKIAGFWLQTPHGEERGSTFEMFIASPREYAALGGWFVPAARYFELTFNDPASVDILAMSNMPDGEGAENVGKYFSDFMRNIVRGRILAGMMQQQTLSIQMGLGTNEP